MRRWIMLFFGIIIINGMLVSEVKAEEVRQEFQRIIEQVEPAVVYIEVEKYDPSVRGDVGKCFGSGFIISPDGYILTCAHVISGRIGEPIVGINNKPSYPPAKVVIINEDYDVALLKVDTTKDVVKFELSSKEIKTGDSVAVAGYPYDSNWRREGFEKKSSFVTANVSTIKRTKTKLTESLTRRVIVLDRTVNPGNSGGPLFYPDSGEVIGIVHGSFGIGTEIGLATPIDIAYTLLIEPMIKIQEKEIEGTNTADKIQSKTTSEQSLEISANEVKKQKRELIQSLINEIKYNDSFLIHLSNLPNGKYISNFQLFVVDSWESIKKVGLLGLNSQLVSNLSNYYTCISQIKYNLNKVVDTESSFKPSQRIVDVQKELIAGAKELAKVNLKISPVILKQLEELLNSL